MDGKIIGLYAAGLSTRDIRAHLEEVYGLKVSADLISRVTDAVLEEVADWQNRALEPMYPIVFLDALRVKIRDAESRQVKNKAVYVALGVTPALWLRSECTGFSFQNDHVIDEFDRNSEMRRSRAMRIFLFDKRNNPFP